ncbi:Iron-sulfur cluster carrier protein [Methanimicrococcus hongohii]|uniref:Iron-sulfur cluster carrier protein n=1 Tax=Methanimicrococcus hongohii TaxID=3028295 RepID=A0AA96UZS3_9EURY|nr:Mrp/NBP35 family ATP-binding protein [Methanimicrococcus sp. Hf6]WNY23654.1 Iron-sulfur cluster carrier protein [Methanimicrococcus sp. Hf6]
MTELNVVNKVPQRPSQPARESGVDMSRIKNVFVVMSGKGGVGKSTVACALAAGLAVAGNHVGLMDCDMHGPSVPAIFGIKPEDLQVVGDKMIPAKPEPNLNLGVISIGLLLPDDDTPVIWRGPAKAGAIQQFFTDVDWGNLDYLIIDLPPGTGDEPLGIMQLLPKNNGAIVVTIPQDIALTSVRKSLTFLQKLEVPLTGIVSNMDGLICPHCDERIDLYNSRGPSGLEKAAADFGADILARLPMDPAFSKAEEEGKMVEWMMNESEWTKEFKKVLEAVEKNSLKQ